MTESLDLFAQHKLTDLASRNLARYLEKSNRSRGGHIVRDGRELVSFCCNDYLGLSQHPEVISAAVAATERYGTGAGGSRLITGNHGLYEELESRLAALKGSESAIVFGSGYLANLGIIPALASSTDLVLADELAHACLWAGGQLRGGRLLKFQHNDVSSLVALLEDHRHEHRRCMVITDGVFSMDGDLAPLRELLEVCDRFDAWLLSDDAHGLGVVGDGRGSSFANGERIDIPLQMGTLSKAVGSYGGYLCASATVVELMRNRARTFVYSTGLPPGVVASAIAAIKIIERDQQLVRIPLEYAKLFCNRLGLDEPQSPIVPIVLGDAAAALAVSSALLEKGFLVNAIRPPTVPANTARLRVTFNATHTEEEVSALAQAVSELIP